MFRTWVGLSRLAPALVHLARGIRVARELGRVDEPGRQQRVGWFARTMLGRLGIAVELQGELAAGPLLLVANHVSWLDILVLHAVCPSARFVSKADVHRWPLIGPLAAAAGTLFIERERPRDSIRVVHEMAAALRRGHTVAVFLEGTTSEGRDLLPFHNGLLQAAISTATPVQAAVLRFSEHGQAVSRSAAYTDGVHLIGSIWRVLRARELRVRVSALPFVRPGEIDRRRLGEHLHRQMRAALGVVDRAD